jgi:glycosyltransferase involved in cell wall biosynthesis
MKPKVSVIIPVYNVEKYLDHCINSILKNSYRNIEVIAVDDGSTDESGKVLKDYAQKDIRMKVIHKSNGGVSSARNAGLDAVEGSYIMFIDADDWMEETAIERLVKLASETDAEIILFNMIYRNIEKQTSKYDAKIFNSNFLITDEEEKQQCIYKEFLKGNRLNQVCRCFFKAGLIIENKLKFDEHLSIGEDLVFLFGASTAAKNILSINDYLYNYRFNSLSSTNVYKASRFNNVKKINSIFQRYLKLWQLDDAEHRQMLSNRLVNSVVENLKCIFFMENNLTIRQKISDASHILKDSDVKTALKCSGLKDKILSHKLIILTLKTKILVPMLYLLLIIYGGYKSYRR